MECSVEIQSQVGTCGKKILICIITLIYCEAENFRKFRGFGAISERFLISHHSRKFPTIQYYCVHANGLLVSTQVRLYSRLSGVLFD